MARIRTIKPEFWTSEQVVSCSIPARLLFIGLWNFCDDYGIHPRSLRRIKMEIFPGDYDMTLEVIDELIGELENARGPGDKHGLVRRYDVDGHGYLQVTGWSRNQKIDRPTSRWPPPQEYCDSESDRRSIDDQSTIARRSFDFHSPPEGKGREGKGSRKGKDGRDRQRSGDSPIDLLPLVEAWNSLDSSIAKYGVRTGPIAKSVLAAWKRTERDSELRDAVSDVPAVLEAIRRAKFCHRKGWFRFAWLFGKNKNGELNVRRLLEGVYDDIDSDPRRGPKTDIDLPDITDRGEDDDQ